LVESWNNPRKLTRVGAGIKQIESRRDRQIKIESLPAKSRIRASVSRVVASATRVGGKSRRREKSASSRQSRGTRSREIRDKQSSEIRRDQKSSRKGEKMSKSQKTQSLRKM
jgi:hypothetical protein